MVTNGMTNGDDKWWRSMQTLAISQVGDIIAPTRTRPGVPRPSGGVPMPRVPRRWQWAEEACYHLMDRGHNRDAVFWDDDDRRAFLRLVDRYRRRFGFRLYHYCLKREKGTP